jgi:DNA mismatch repair protein MutS
VNRPREETDPSGHESDALIEAQRFTDATTRIDLELESRADPAASVFAAFTRPRTAAGAAALRARLGAPLATVPGILAAQDAVRDCQKTTGAFRGLVESARPERIQRYLHSQIEVPRAGAGVGDRLHAAWTAARHAECVAIAREGRDCLTRFVSSCRDWWERSSALHASPVVRTLDERLQSIATHLGAALESCGTGSVDLLRADRLLRGDHHGAIQEALQVLGELDALHALADTGETNGWVFPALLEGAPVVTIAGLRHPLVASAVENDVHLAGDRRVLLLTGPNMAGKTTYMKSLGIAVYLAQIGMAVPARAMELTPFDRLITVIGIHDSVASGSSAFHYEVARLGHGLDALLSGERCLLLFDELMRGTNAHDAEEACRLVIDALLVSGKCCAALSTHVSGLVDAFADEARLTLGHFEAAMKDHALEYDFRLRAGGYRGRMAMALLKQMGVTAKLSRLRDDAMTTGTSAWVSGPRHQPALPPSGSGPTE